MGSADFFPLLLGLFAILAVGLVLRATGRMGDADAAALNRVVLDATMPALILSVLQRSAFGEGSWSAVFADIVALFANVAAGIAVTRALGLPRATQGSAGMVAGFSNTGFLGIPMTLAVYGHEAAGTAILIDTVATTLLLWTAGVAIAGRMGARTGFDARGLLVIARQPAMVAIPVGLALRALAITLPAWAAHAVDMLASATPLLVFLSLGLSLDVRALRGRALPLGIVAALKLFVAPAIVFGVTSVLRVPRQARDVAVLQASMPTAMVSVIIAGRYGCDASFAAAAAVVTTLGTLVSLPLVLEAIRRLGD